MLRIILIIFALLPAISIAQTDEIQVYDAEIAAPGVFNLTWHNNFTPSGPTVAAQPGGVIPDHSLNGVPEWAYGVAPWFEAGLYLPLYTVTGSGAVLFNGFKLRTLFVEPNAADQVFIYGINFEFSDNTAHWDAHRYTGEIRPIIGWHLGRLDFIVNPIVDNDYEGCRETGFRARDPSCLELVKILGSCRGGVRRLRTAGALLRPRRAVPSILLGVRLPQRDAHR